MNRAEIRSNKRKEIVEAIIVREEPVHLVAQIYNIPQRTIFDWLSRYRSGGWGALIEGARTGRKRKLSADDMKWLYDAITLGNPLNHPFEFCLWTLNVIREMLVFEKGIKLSKSSISRLLGHLGLSPQRPLYKSYKQDPKKIEQYISKTFPDVARQAKNLGAQIYFVDEASVRSDSHRGDMRFSFIEGKMNSKRFIKFLKQLQSDAGQPIVVIVDNARYHHSKETQAFIKSREESDNGNIVMAFLPPYSPELNPDEQVWNHAKSRLSKLPLASKEAMKSSFTSILRSIQKTTSLIKSFFKMKDTLYITDAMI